MTTGPTTKLGVDLILTGFLHYHEIERSGRDVRPRRCWPPPPPRWRRWAACPGTPRRRPAARSRSPSQGVRQRRRGRGGSDLFALAGASVADERHDLSRHWRNARTHASHDPVDWKYHHVGNFRLNHVLPPNHGQL